MKGICSETAQSRFWFISDRIIIEIVRKLLRRSQEQTRIDFQLNSNCNLKETASRQPRADSNWFSSNFKLKLKGICSEAAQTRFRLIFNYIQIENKRKLFWGSPGQILIDFQINSDWKWKESAVRQCRADSNWFPFQFYLKMKGSYSDA